eukprot:symbB.v1.2.009964.t1/scaffold623.1/size335370/7
MSLRFFCLVSVVASLVRLSYAHDLKNLSWQGLSDGLKAWEAFGFDTGFSFEVNSSSGILFRYPSSNIVWSQSVPNPEVVEILIKGAKSNLLSKVTSPVVMAILSGKDPSLTTGARSVSRAELLAQGGGVTLPALISAYTSRSDATVNQSGWQVIQQGIDVWASLGWDKHFSFNVGNQNGSIFTYTKGRTDMRKRLPGASLSKWPAALTIAGLVADGTLSFDDKANKYLDWWSTDPSDTRSNITLRHLMTFQSGYTSDPRVLCQFNPFADFLNCVKTLYNAANHSSPPGRSWSYISIHLQFAAAMAVAASGLPPDAIFEKYLYKPLGMNGTSWLPKRNPQFAAGIITTGADFEKMLHKMLTYEFLGKKVLSEMEKDWSAAPVSPSGDGWFGHYGMGHWYDCMGYGSGQSSGASATLDSWCLSEEIQAGPGAFGFFPLIDRKRGYYMQIVLREDPKCRSEIPEYLRIIAKPVVDAILAGKPLSDEDLLKRRGGLVLREVYDIYKSLPPHCWPLETSVTTLQI